ncbi:Serine/threonine exchanger SteT [Emticicia aquatica]|uniref:Serine/threonine exchanger SteT n=1 Tax=Emticicia aquatica TaxID=1681835 RepID=A0ABN8ESQ6_9BACT|nr:amino acid permease [Emticicia aquatica]CAH0994916.1 Serine/threonine exchanger SteT [Emticicia aquatica]
MSNLLKKQISLYSLTMIAIGSSIGSGIFRTPSEIARYLPSEGLMLSVWVIGGIIALFGALTFAKISAQFTKVGGFYVFIKEAFGDLPAFLYGWSMLMVINTGSLAALSLVFTSYLKVFFSISENIELVIAIGAITILTIMNILGVKLGSIFASIFTSAKLLGIFSVVFIGIFFGTNSNINFTNTVFSENTNNLSIIPAFGLALIGVSFSYGGYQHATFIAAEVKNASKIVPKALILGILIVCLAYLTINFAYLKLISILEIANSNSVASDAISTVWALGGKFISFLIILSVLGTIGIYILTAPRIYFAMADDKLFFKKFAEVHPKYRTPFWAIIFQSIWTIILLIFWKTFSNLITYVVFVDTAFFLLTAAAYFKLIKEKTFFGKLAAIVFIAMCFFIISNTLLEKPQQALAGISFLGIGSILYQYFRRKME